ncbi:14089_t:CDS:1, partial [Cetraspora pellucida]
STTFRFGITQDIVFSLNHLDTLLQEQPKGLQVVLFEHKQ